VHEHCSPNTGAQQQQSLQPTSLQPVLLQQQPQQQQDHQPLCQLLQHQPLEQMAPTASRVMPQLQLDLLQSFLMQQDRRRLEGAAAAGVVVPRSRLGFSLLQH
jgi:hypothetical protein